LGVNAEDSHLLVPHLGVVNFICCVNWNRADGGGFERTSVGQFSSFFWEPLGPGIRMFWKTQLSFFFNYFHFLKTRAGFQNANS
jgi:hypothetical protein